MASKINRIAWFSPPPFCLPDVYEYFKYFRNLQNNNHPSPVQNFPRINIVLANAKASPFCVLVLDKNKRELRRYRTYVLCYSESWYIVLVELGTWLIDSIGQIGIDTRNWIRCNLLTSFCFKLYCVGECVNDMLYTVIALNFTCSRLVVLETYAVRSTGCIIISLSFVGHLK